MAEYVAMSGPLVIVKSTKDFDRKKIMKSQLFQPYRDPYGPPYGPYGDPYRQGGLFPGGDVSMLFLTDKTVLIGAPWELARYSEHAARNPAPKAKPMEAALALAAKPNAVAMGGHIPAELRRLMFMPFGPDSREIAPMAPLLQTEMALALNVGKSLELTAQFQAATEASAEQSVQALKNLRILAELAIEKSNDAAEPGGWKLIQQKRLTQAINTAVIEQKGTLVSAKLKMELDPILVKQYTKEFVKNIRVGSDRTQTINNLKIIGIALHSYHDANGNALLIGARERLWGRLPRLHREPDDTPSGSGLHGVQLRDRLDHRPQLLARRVPARLRVRRRKLLPSGDGVQARSGGCSDDAAGRLPALHAAAATTAAPVRSPVTIPPGCATRAGSMRRRRRTSSRGLASRSSQGAVVRSTARRPRIQARRR
jgi:hypothetical protein